eukprot:1406155-Karenia_brevis.AAC.1
MVFCPDGDPGVCYQGEEVVVDGNLVDIKIYGMRIRAQSSFKYLGVTLQASGPTHLHMHTKVEAFERATNMFFSGLRRLASFSHDFQMYLWQTLVVPVGLYGAELHSDGELGAQQVLVQERTAWRRLLQVGGRAPNHVVHTLLGIQTWEVEARIRQGVFLAKLVNAPIDSWQHVALLWHVCHGSTWYSCALSHLTHTIPTLRLQIGSTVDK